MSGMQSIKRDGLRKLVDLCMLLLLLCLMSYQVTGEEKHEWTGILMTLTVLLHQFLNRRWYAALFKGKYNPYRSVTTAVNILLLASMLVTAFCGMSMSEYAVPFLYWARGLMLVRPAHLAMSHWSFVLMGLHLGLHIPLMLGRMKDSARSILTAVGAVIAGVGLWLFLRNGMPNYLFFRVPFAFLDYEKAFWLVFLENALMLSSWAFFGAELAVLCMKRKKPALILGSIAAAVALGLALNTAFPGENDLNYDAAWTVPEARPEIAQHIDNMDEYDTILLGYPNWWASIPMPIASFLDEYDFSGKQIIPFCSHGGGRFGQSLTAIAKLAPDANMGEGLSVHHSGGNGLSANVSAWLEKNNIK